MRSGSWKFLDAHFYQKLLEEGGSQSFRRVSDVELQKAGVDVIGSAAGRMAFIDEKAQLYYGRSPLPAVTFELSFRSHGRERRGWNRETPGAITAPGVSKTVGNKKDGQNRYFCQKRK